MAKKQRFHVIFENVAGKLDERFADTEESAKAKTIELLKDLAYLQHGDCIRIVDRKFDE